MVCSVDQLASQTGLEMLKLGGNAVDAAIAVNAVLSVTTQHMCGLGGDLWAVIAPPGVDPVALNASGFAGAGADPDQLRAAGHRTMPRYELGAVTLPGCVDGWLAAHERFGTLPLSILFKRAIHYATDGFPASPALVAALPDVAHLAESADYFEGGPPRPGSMIRRPGLARTLSAIVKHGRAGFYGGEFGEQLLRLGAGQFRPDDLSRPIARWTPALRTSAWGHQIWTAPPNSQGYITLAAAAIAAGLELPDSPDDAAWAHLLIEATRQAAFDREDVLYENADGDALVDEQRLGPRRSQIDPSRAAPLGGSFDVGGTTAITVVDRDRMGVTFIQSNASGFGARIIVPGVRIFLQNRGLAFSLTPGHPAELQPGRRPPHTLCPTVLTTNSGSLSGVIGAAGGDGQPQFLLQLITRWLLCGEEPGSAIEAGRWFLDSREGGEFNSWKDHGAVRVLLEAHAPLPWHDGLAARGHLVERVQSDHQLFGIAQLITVEDGRLAGATDPRALIGSVAGY
jgi:gamma-glutamyltranspeptidase/glutathione hydrolase